LPGRGNHQERMGHGRAPAREKTSRKASAYHENPMKKNAWGDRPKATASAIRKQNRTVLPEAGEHAESQYVWTQKRVATGPVRRVPKKRGNGAGKSIASSLRRENRPEESKGSSKDPRTPKAHHGKGTPKTKRKTASATASGKQRTPKQEKTEVKIGESL